MEGDPGNYTQMIIMLAILVAGSAFFSAIETAFSSVSQLKLKTKADDGNRKAIKALKLLDNYDKLISTILIGNNIVNILAASIGAVLFVELIGKENGPTVSTIVLTIVILIFGEITPKSLAKDHSEKIVLFVTDAVNILITLMTPLNFIFSAWKKMLHLIFGGSEDTGITEEELVTIIDQVEADGNLEKQETDLLRSALEFNDIEVSEILIPRVDVEAVSLDVTIGELQDIFEDTGYSRLPVYEENIDHVVGIVHEKDIYRIDEKDKQIGELRSVVKEVVYVATSSKISIVLKSLQHGKSHMAVVLDEYGGTSGIVTLEDILEELVGEIWDEHDEIDETIKEEKDGSLIVSSTADISEVLGRFNIDDTECEASSIPALVVDSIGKIPEAGDKFTYSDKLDITVTKTENHRVTEVKIREVESA